MKEVENIFPILIKLGLKLNSRFFFLKEQIWKKTEKSTISIDSVLLNNPNIVKVIFLMVSKQAAFS